MSTALQKILALALDTMRADTSPAGQRSVKRVEHAITLKPDAIGVQAMTALTTLMLLELDFEEVAFAERVRLRSAAEGRASLSLPRESGSASEPRGSMEAMTMTETEQKMVARHRMRERLSAVLEGLNCEPETLDDEQLTVLATVAVSTVACAMLGPTRTHVMLGEELCRASGDPMLALAGVIGPMVARFGDVATSVALVRTIHVVMNMAKGPELLAAFRAAGLPIAEAVRIPTPAGAKPS